MSDINIKTLLSAASVTGAAVEFLGGKQDVHVGYTPITQTVVAYGTWDTATVQIQLSPDAGTTWIDISGASFTANGSVNIAARRGLTYRAEVSSAGGSTSVTVKAYQ